MMAGFALWPSVVMILFSEVKVSCSEMFICGSGCLLEFVFLGGRGLEAL